MPTETATPAHDSPAAPETAAPATVTNPPGNSSAEQSTAAAPTTAPGEPGAKPQAQDGGHAQKGPAKGNGAEDLVRPCTGIEAHAVAVKRATGKWPHGYIPSKRAMHELRLRTGSVDAPPGGTTAESQGAKGSDDQGASPGGQGEGAPKTLNEQYGQAETAKAGEGTVLMAADFELAKRGFTDADMLDLKPERRIALAAKFRAQRNAGNPGRSAQADPPGSQNPVASENPTPPAAKAKDPHPSQVQTDDPLAGLPQDLRESLELSLDEGELEKLRTHVSGLKSKPETDQQPRERTYSEGEQKLAHRNMSSVAKELSAKHPTLTQPGAWQAFSQRLMEYAEQIGVGDEMCLDVELLSQSAERVYAVFSAHDVRAAKTAQAGKQAAANQGSAMPAPKGGGQGQSGALRSAPTKEQHARAALLAAQECAAKHGGDRQKNRELYEKHIREIVGTA